MNVFTSKEYCKAFQEFRVLPDDVFAKYYSCLNPPLVSFGEAADIGAGPGLQTYKLIQRLPPKWKMTVIEPSGELINEAKIRLENYAENTRYINKSLKEFSINSNQIKFDYIWMSEVVHLLGDIDKCTLNMASILNNNSRILIRTSTHEQLRDRQWYKFFPEALTLDLKRHPSKNSVVQGLKKAGFENIVATTIDETRMISSKFLVQMIGRKAFSTLHCINENEFQIGFSLLKEYYAGIEITPWHYEMTGYTATFLR